MKTSGLNTLRRRIDEAGSPQDRRQAILLAVQLLGNLINRLEHEKEALSILFRRLLTAWWSSPVPADQIPFLLTEEHRAARLYRFAAIGCLAFEALLAAWISVTLGLPWWSGALIAILASLIFHGGFSLAFRQPERPKEVLGKIKRWLLWPSLAGFAISFSLLILARTVTGELALLLLPVFGVSLWTTTLSLLLMGAALFAAAHVVDWSHKLYQDYAALDSEQLNLRLLREEFLDGFSAPASEMTVQSAPAVDSSDSTPTRRLFPLGRVATILLLAGLASLSSSCTTSSPIASPAGGGPEYSRVEGQPERDLEIFLDDSKSPADVAGSALRNLVEHLPELAEKWGITQLRFYTFGCDGWLAKEKLSTSLPQLKLPVHQQTDAGELRGLKNIQVAIAKHRQAQADQEETKAREAYRRQVKRALAAVKGDLLAPSDSPEPPCTDLRGVLRRIARTSSARPRLVVLITDGVESCSSSIHPVTKPEGDVRLVIILVPERPEDGAAKKGRRGSDQFTARSAQLSAAVPWAKVLPHFTDLSRIFEQ